MKVKSESEVALSCPTLSDPMNCSMPGLPVYHQLPNIRWIMVKAREFQKKSISALLTIPKPLTVWITINCGKILNKMGKSDHLTCLLRNLYAGQEVTVRTGHGTINTYQSPF